MVYRPPRVLKSVINEILKKPFYCGMMKTKYGLITEKMYLERIATYKSRQTEIVEQMGRHEKADRNFYITANLVMNLTARSREIFESSEADEKR